MMRTKTGLVLALLTTVALVLEGSEQATFGDGPYLGQEPPGLIAEVFAPGLIPEEEWVGCSGFLDGGTVFVFSSMKTGTDWRFKPTYVMRLENGSWTEPEVAPFSRYMPYNFTVGPGGKTIYFTTLKSPDKSTSMLLEQANIWAVTLADNGWTEPVMLGASINTEDYYENYPTVASDGTIYYMSRRDDTVGKTDIYVSRNRDGKYAAAENLGPPVNSVESDQDPWVAPDGSYLIVCLTGRAEGFGKYDLYVSFPEQDGSWSEPVNLGDGVNGPESEFRPYVTHDGKYLFFTAPDPDSGFGRIFWVSSEVIHSNRVGE